MSAALHPSQTYAPYDPSWLALRQESVLEPELRIVDAHHHLWDLPRPRYLADDLAVDVGSGHAVSDTIYVDCRSMYRTSGPEHLRPLGEIEFARDAAKSASTSVARLCAGIVGYADLSHPQVEDFIDAALRIGQERFKGIRQIANWDPDPLVISPPVAPPRHLLLQTERARGFSILADRALSFDTFVYHHQLADVAVLAARHPTLSIVLDHLGAPLGIGRHAGQRKEVFVEWREAMARLAGFPNVTVKIGGMGMRMFGFGFEALPAPPSSATLARFWSPYALACVELFGAERAMLESNFPPDKASCSYVVLWNAFKRIFASASAMQKRALFETTARRVYRLHEPPTA